MSCTSSSKREPRRRDNPYRPAINDANLRSAEGRHYLIIKAEGLSPPKKHLQIASSADVRGPFSPLSAPVTPAGLGVEGTTALRIGAQTLLYFDAFQTEN